MIARPEQPLSRLEDLVSGAARRGRATRRWFVGQLAWAVLVGVIAWAAADGGLILLPDLPVLPSSLSLGALWFLGAAIGVGVWALRSGFGPLVERAATNLLHRLLVSMVVFVPVAAGVLTGLLWFGAAFLARAWSLFWGRWFMAGTRVSRIRRPPRLRALWRLSTRTAVASTTSFMDRFLDPWLSTVRGRTRRIGLGAHVGWIPMDADGAEELRLGDGLPATLHTASQLEPPPALHASMHVFEGVPWIRSPRGAETLRRALGLDVVVWGRMQNNGSAWLHVQRPRIATVADTELFPTRWSLDLPPVMRLDVRNLDEVELAVRLLELQALCDRDRRRPLLVPRSGDRLLGALPRHHEEWAETMIDRLRRIPEEGAVPDRLPTVRTSLVRAASDWVGFELSSAHTTVNETRLQRRLVETIEKCLLLDPDEPVHYYRYAALLCLLDEEESSVRALAAAASRAEDFPLRVAESDIAVVASDLSAARTHHERRLVLARGAARAARAVHVAGPEAAQSLREALESHRWWDDVDEFRRLTGLSVLRSVTVMDETPETVGS